MKSILALLLIFSTNAFATQDTSQQALTLLTAKASSVVVINEQGVRIGTLASILPERMANLANRSKISIRNKCSSADEMNLIECRLVLSYGDMTGDPAGEQATVFEYTAQAIQGVVTGLSNEIFLKIIE